MRAVRRSALLTGAMVMVVACTAEPVATPTAPAASAAAPTVTPIASPTSSSAVHPTAGPPTPPPPAPIPTAEATSWDKVFSIERGSLGDLIAGPDGLIAAGCVGDAESDCARRIVVISADGETWQSVDVDAPPDIFTWSLHRVDDRLFALDYGHYGPDGGAVVWTSLDGRSWTQVEASSFRGRAVRDLIEWPLGTLATGYQAPIDSDNTSGFLAWPVRADGTFGAVRVFDLADGPALVSGATWTGEEFLAWGVRDGPSSRGPTTLLASPDGKAWTVRAEVSAPKGADVAQIVTKGDRLVAVGYEGRSYPISARAWTSTDGGRSWRLATVPKGNAAMDAVAVEGSVLIARGRAFTELGSPRKAVSWSSSDGRAWTRLPDDQDMPGVPGFSASTRATIGDRICVASTLSEETRPRAAIYCR
jgi:hypothetical protein